MYISVSSTIKRFEFKGIEELKKVLKAPIGFSDHSIGIDASFLSVAMGANIIEKHYSYDTSRKDLIIKFLLMRRDSLN